MSSTAATSAASAASPSDHSVARPCAGDQAPTGVASGAASDSTSTNSSTASFISVLSPGSFHPRHVQVTLPPGTPPTSSPMRSRSLQHGSSGNDAASAAVSSSLYPTLSPVATSLRRTSISSDLFVRLHRTTRSASTGSMSATMQSMPVILPPAPSADTAQDLSGSIGARNGHVSVSHASESSMTQMAHPLRQARRGMRAGSVSSLTSSSSLSSSSPSSSPPPAEAAPCASDRHGAGAAADAARAIAEPSKLIDGSQRLAPVPIVSPPRVAYPSAQDRDAEVRARATSTSPTSPEPQTNVFQREHHALSFYLDDVPPPSDADDFAETPSIPKGPPPQPQTPPRSPIHSSLQAEVSSIEAMAVASLQPQRAHSPVAVLSMLPDLAGAEPLRAASPEAPQPSVVSTSPVPDVSPRATPPPSAQASAVASNTIIASALSFPSFGRSSSPDTTAVASAPAPSSSAVVSPRLSTASAPPPPGVLATSLSASTIGSVERRSDLTTAAVAASSPAQRSLTQIPQMLSVLEDADALVAQEQAEKQAEPPVSFLSALVNPPPQPRTSGGLSFYLDEVVPPSATELLQQAAHKALAPTAGDGDGARARVLQDDTVPAHKNAAAAATSSSSNLDLAPDSEGGPQVVAETFAQATSLRADGDTGSDGTPAPAPSNPWTQETAISTLSLGGFLGSMSSSLTGSPGLGSPTVTRSGLPSGSLSRSNSFRNLRACDTDAGNGSVNSPNGPRSPGVVRSSPFASPNMAALSRSSSSRPSPLDTPRITTPPVVPLVRGDHDAFLLPSSLPPDLPTAKRIKYNMQQKMLFVNLEAMHIAEQRTIDEIEDEITVRMSSIGGRVDAIFNYDDVNIEDHLITPYTEAMARLTSKYFASIKQYSGGCFFPSLLFESFDPRNCVTSSKLAGGALIGTYLVESTIGQGDFGHVKLAVDTTNGTKVALKIMDKKLIDVIEAWTFVEREQHILSYVKHPCIPGMIEAVEDDEFLYFVLEFARGTTLGAFLQRRGSGTVTEAEARVVLRDVLDALQYCHRHGIVHRDIKPGNLILDLDDEAADSSGEHVDLTSQLRRVYLLDFGAADQFDPTDRDEHGHLVPHHTLFCGTPDYCAPEMFVGAAYAGPEVDVYSLGTLLFFMVAGYLPFQYSHDKLSGEYQLPDEVSESLRDLLRRMLSVSPADRRSLDFVAAHPWMHMSSDHRQHDAASAAAAPASPEPEAVSSS